MTDVRIRREEAQGGGPVTWRQDWSDAVSASQGSPRIAGTRRGEEEDGMGQSLLESLQRKHGLLTPCCWTSSLQECGRTHFCCLKSPSL